MYLMENLLRLLNSDGADELRLRVGYPPVILLEGDAHPMEGPPLTPETAEELFMSIADTRQRRELWARGTVRFIYRFRKITPFVVRAQLENDSLGMDIL